MIDDVKLSKPLGQRDFLPFVPYYSVYLERGWGGSDAGAYVTDWTPDKAKAKGWLADIKPHESSARIVVFEAHV